MLLIVGKVFFWMLILLMLFLNGVTSIYNFCLLVSNRHKLILILLLVVMVSFVFVFIFGLLKGLVIVYFLIIITNSIYMIIGGEDSIDSIGARIVLACYIPMFLGILVFWDEFANILSIFRLF